MEQSEARYKEMLDRASHERHPQKVFKAEFITADCTKVGRQPSVYFPFATMLTFPGADCKLTIRMLLILTSHTDGCTSHRETNAEFL